MEGDIIGFFVFGFYKDFDLIEEFYVVILFWVCIVGSVLKVIFLLCCCLFFVD